MKIFFSIVFSIFLANADGLSQAAIRMIAHDLHEGQLIVDLQIRATNEVFVLSSHNLRIYYNTEVASLSAFYSALPTGTFVDIEIAEMKQNVDASIVRDLPYDHDLGFVNLNISHNSSNGDGVEITEEWTKIGSIIFNGSGDIKAMQATWARPDRTEDYATAFVEVTKWEGNRSTDVNVEQYGDLTWQRIETIDTTPQLTIGPNPSADYVMVDHQWTGNVAYELISIQGVRMQEGTLTHARHKIDLSDYTAGTYIIRIHTEDRSYNQIIEKVDFN